LTDHVTILSHSHSRLAKLWAADGTIKPYDDTKNYSVRTEHVADINALSALLTSLEPASRSGVIRGLFKGDVAASAIDPEHHKPGLARKIKALYDDAPLHWVLIEVDKFKSIADPVREPVAAITEYIRAHLPPEFFDRSYHWQLSSSAGHPSAAGNLKVHLWFWLAEPATSDDLKRWAETQQIAVDKSVLNSVQFHYTAAPLAEPGVVIPVPVRSGLESGLFGDEVSIDFGRAAPMSTALAPWEGDADDLLSLTSTLDWSIEHARSVLFTLNADSDRATWVNDLAAFHHETHGTPEALEIAVEWSQQAANFADRKDVEDRWTSFGKYRGTPMTGRWLLKRQGECQVQLKYDAKGEWAEKIKAATDEFTLREKVCPQIVKDGRLDDMARESIAQMLFDTFKRLGTKYPIAQCRKLLVEKRSAKQGGLSALPEWVQPWVYVTDDDKFYRLDSEEWLTMQGFNARFNRELPTDEDGAMAKSAGWTVLDDMHIPSVTKALYLPWAAPKFDLEGVACVNTYRPSAVPQPVATLSPEGRAAVSVVRQHLNLIAGGRQEVVATMVDWLAHNVQHPGVKIRWAPLVKGVEGDGKTLLGSLLAAVMGRVNVRNVSPKVLGTDFTGWAEGSCVAVLEEIKLTGHNRYDILNALKPFITNDSIEVHAKGKDPRDAINTTNYIAFTNYQDALPLTETDRRWWIVFTPFTSSSEMARAVAPLSANLGLYFDRLHEAIQQHPAELRRWLLDHSIGTTFKPNGSAPATDEKARMISASTSEEEDMVRFILEDGEGRKGVTPTVFASRLMRRELLSLDSSLEINTTAGNRLFARCGFSKLPKKVKWDGEAHTVWVRGSGSMSTDEVRTLLDQTLKFGAEGSEVEDLFK